MNPELLARLRRLRREEPSPVEPGAPRAPSQEPAEPSADVPAPREVHGALPDWLAARLARGFAVRREPERRAEPPAELEEEAGARGPFAARRRTFAAGHAHGDWALGDALAAAGDELAWLARDPALAALAPGSAVYLDIETTGLSGGAGTIPFLVALGRFEGSGLGGERFELWQAFLRDPSEEAAALAEVAERIRGASAVVSFFGKSFDRHRLEDKMRLHRIAPPFGGKPHLDLYHPLARLYRGALADGRLATVERELCGVAREHDLSGAHAPAAWFDFLDGREHALEGVFRHNELDVLSLVVLTAHLARARDELRADGRALPGCGRTRARALAELCAARGEHGAALEWLAKAAARGAADGALLFRRAELLRKDGQRERALDEFLELARARRDEIGARAWGEALRLAKRLKRPELEAEARAHGPQAIEETLTGRARARALVPYEPPHPRAARPRVTRA